jgi:hypothetical protein
MSLIAVGLEGSHATRSACRGTIIQPTPLRGVQGGLTDHKLIRPVAAFFIN